MEKQRSLDRLVTVSKIFRDARFEQICKENAELRLQLFWKDHNTQMLEDAMRHANNWEKSPKCNCWKCSLSGRKDDDVEVDELKTCEFIPWFEEKITACDLTIGYVQMGSTSKYHMSNNLNPVWDVDCHFVKIVMMGGDWSAFTYGSKLWDAKTVNDPELRKLEKLFKLLDQENDE